ncbi:porin PorA family protein [Nocardia sp. NPDC058640]|uniref:porin PorA family protein n=1 Tax=Nocardia sp. NPDC058640 TaxID=3346571 RepID=UPI0036500259
MSVFLSRVRKSAVVFALLGAVLVIGAVIVRFVVVPSSMKLPDDLNQVQKFEGTTQALNAQALMTGDLANLLTPQLPITADASLVVDAVDGDTAIVTRSAAIKMPDASVQNNVHTYAVSRVDYSPVPLDDAQRTALVPADKLSGFEAHSGLVFSWPMNPAKDGTTLYDPVTRVAQPVTFADEGELNGRPVFNYRVDASGPIADQAIMAQFTAFPKQLPKTLIAGLLQAGVVPEQSRAPLAAALPTMPDMLDLGFAGTNQVRTAVDTEFGAPLRFDQTQGIYATVKASGQDIPTVPLSITALHTTDAEVATTAKSMSDNATLLSIMNLWLPLGLLITGLGLIGYAATRPRPEA